MADDVVLDERALQQFLTSPAGPVGQLLATLGARVAQSAKRHAPVSPHGSHGRGSGYLRSRIGWEVKRDRRGLHVDITSPARTGDGRDFPYGYAQSLEVLHGRGGHRIKTTPHLQPALREIVSQL